MEIVYKNIRIKEKYEDKDKLSSITSVDVAKSYERFKLRVTLATDFAHLKRVNRSLNIEKLGTGLFGARLNDKWRVEFEWHKEEVKLIAISRIHPHKYKK